MRGYDMAFISTARAAVAAGDWGLWTGSQDPGGCSNLSDREIQHELRSTEDSIRLQPRLCALRRSPARETDQSGSNQRTSQENIRNEQEAGNTSALGRTQSSWDVISEVDTLIRDPNSSLEAPNSAVFEAEASSASHGVWGRIQTRLPAAFQGGREWLGRGHHEEVRYTTSQVTQAGGYG